MPADPTQELTINVKQHKMRKLIAAMNMTLDGICDHTVMTADDEIHQYYNDLLSNADTLIYGRTTYQLMESFFGHLL
jgi:dihydrofolate reductase